MRWLSYPVYKLLLAYFIGILLAYYYNISLKAVTIVAAFCFLIIGGSVFKVIPFNYRKGCFTISSLVLIALLGYGNVKMNDVSFQKTHFTHAAQKDVKQVIKLRLVEQLINTTKNNRFYAQVIQIDDQATSGKTLVQIPIADSLKLALNDELLTVGTFYNIKEPNTNSDFNYKTYLSNINIYEQLYIGTNHIVQINNSNPKPFILELRNTLTASIKTSGLSEQSQSFIEALLLGQRQHLDPAITTSFRDAGVIHILALSGLHVGILLFIIQFLSRPILRLPKGKWLQTILVITLLWLFAFITGLSPSILRAVTMFSFVAIGMNINRKSSVFHSLAISAFVLLVLNPKLLFLVGFQLSYMAVFSIVLLQPLLQVLWRPKYKVPRYLYGIFTVTLAAQIGVAPLSLYYFHQFPGLFLLGNMILLPVLPLLLGLGILIIALTLLGFKFDLFVNLLNNFIDKLTQIIQLIAGQKQFLITNVFMDTLQLILVYIALFAVGFYFYRYAKRSKKEKVLPLRATYGLHMSLGCLIILCIYTAYNKSIKDDKLIIVHQPYGTLIHIKTPDNSLLLKDFHAMDRLRAEQSLAYILSSKEISPHVKQDSLQNLIKWENYELAIIGKTNVYSPLPNESHVLLSHSPGINLERFIKDKKPKCIIADGSNYKSTIAQWQLTCEKYKTPFYNTYEMGNVDLDKLD